MKLERSADTYETPTVYETPRLVTASSSTSGITLHNVAHRYAEPWVLNGVDLDVAAGEIVCLLGASGSGKSTLLRIIAGLEPLQQGELWFRGKCMATPHMQPAPETRNFGMVFQDHVLFPHLTVADNVGFGITDRCKKDRAELVQQQLTAVGLHDYGKRYPHTLSGGQQQRVALARALATQPQVMLLDEPFASVDSTLRRRLREDARRVLKANGSPAVMVTHDADEALEMADRIAVMADGKIVQQGSPQTIYQQPANQFVAQLFDDAQIIAGERAAGGAQTAFGTIRRPATGSSANGNCNVVVRRGGVSFCACAQTSPYAAQVRDLRFLGNGYLVVMEATGQRLRSFSAALPTVKVGDWVNVTFDPASVFIYN